MSLKAIHQELLGAIACAAVLIIGCHKPDAPRPAGNSTDLKAQIYRHLANKSGQKNFTPGMDVDLTKVVTTLRSNATFLEQRTASVRASLRAIDGGNDAAAGGNRASLERELQQLERTWETARIEAARKQEELSNQEDAYIRSIREQMAGVRTYETLYRLIGQQLATADRLLADPDPARRRTGLRIAREACGHANSDSVDVWLAARICEAYLWPNLDLADTTPGSRERTLDLLETCRRVFFDTYETNNVLKNYQMLLANAPDARAADTFRVQLADWLEEKRNLKHAAAILDEIRDAEVLASAHERITRVKGSLAANPLPE